MATPPTPPEPGGAPKQNPPSSAGKVLRTTQVILVNTVLFTFISYWKTAAVVLCDLASTAYYIGGIVESAIGKAAPYYILGVMVFSYFVRNVYIESCSMFVRGGVYRVVRQAMGGFMGKLAVSALLFDYILTGPISSVSAGQYIVSLAIEFVGRSGITMPDPAVIEMLKSYGSMGFAIAVTLYFYRLNVIGIHESADKAFKIMIATSIMAALMIGWCGYTLYAYPEKATLPSPRPNLEKKFELDHQTGQRVPKLNRVTGQQEDPLGFLGHWLPAEQQAKLRETAMPWLSFVGLFGIMVAFSHSILAMSGEETLAQVYREVQAPKLKNFRKAARVVFIYSLLLTSVISFFAVMIIPDDQRTGQYVDNLIGGLAMNVAGPVWAKLLLNAFVVVIGSLILSGAVNTAIIGSNGVLNRVAEDGVVPVWLQKPHPKYGTTYRILRVILVLKIATILFSRGDVILLGEAYAFGVVWSFVFMSLAMVMLRIRQPDLPREYKVPFNIRLFGVEIPLGLIGVFLALLMAAIVNLLTKEVATISGLAFTAAFLVIFTVSERVNRKQHRIESEHGHLEQFNIQTSDSVSTESLDLKRPYTKLVAIRSPHNLFMLEKALAETDPETTSVVVMTAKMMPDDGAVEVRTDLDPYDQQLMTAVVDRAEKAGKKVKPLIVPTNNPLHAILRLARELHAQEVILGASNKYAADEHMEQIALYWMNVSSENDPLTVRLLSRDRDMYLDLNGGNRIPKISERQARTVAELRAAGVGVDRVLLAHDGSRAASDLFQAVLTMLDAQVMLGLARIPGDDPAAGLLSMDMERAEHLGRDVTLESFAGEDLGEAIVNLARESAYDLIIVPKAQGDDTPGEGPEESIVEYVLKHAHCPVFVAVPPPIPPDVAAE